jgi:hypothetical protein
MFDRCLDLSNWTAHASKLKPPARSSDLRKSPAGHDLVIQYDHLNGPN